MTETRKNVFARCVERWIRSRGVRAMTVASAYTSNPITPQRTANTNGFHCNAARKCPWKNCMPHRVIPHVTHGRLVSSWNTQCGHGNPSVNQTAAKPSDKTEALNQINSWSSSPGASRRTESCIWWPLMVRRGPRTHEHECDEHSPAATNNQRKKNG